MLFSEKFGTRETYNGMQHGIAEANPYADKAAI